MPHYKALYCLSPFRIDKNGIVKVADFGLTEDMYCTNYFRRQHSETGREEKVPIRWMAPESIENDIYNEATDVVRTRGIIFPAVDPDILKGDLPGVDYRVYSTYRTILTMPHTSCRV